MMRTTPGNNIDFLRLALAVLVIFSHAYWLSLPNTRDPLERFSTHQVEFGTAAVDGFFALSGYLISMSAARARSLREFLKRRVLRIYPGFIVALAVSAFVVMPCAVADPASCFGVRQIAKWLMFSGLLFEWRRGDAFMTNPSSDFINGSLWTIKFEFLCYLLVLALAAMSLMRSRWVAAVGFMLVFMMPIACGIFGVPLTGVRVAGIMMYPSSAIACIMFFLAGMFYWRFEAYFRFRPVWAIGFAIALIVTAKLPTSHLFGLVLPVAWTYLVLGFGLAGTPGLTNFATRVGGDYSYGVYLYAFPIQQLTTMAFGGHMSPWLNFAIAAPLSLLCGVASWHLVEKRFLRRDRVERAVTIVPDESLATPAAG